MKRVTIVGINGSLREGSYTKRTLEHCLAAARAAGAAVILFDLREEPMPFCDGREFEETYPQPVHRLRELIEQADGVIFATPEYGGSFSAAIKNAVDLLGPSRLLDKPAGVIGVAAGSSASLSVAQLSAVLLHVGCHVMPVHAQLPVSELVFRNIDSRTSRLALSAVAQLGIRMAAISPRTPRSSHQ